VGDHDRHGSRSEDPQWCSSCNVRHGGQRDGHRDNYSRVGLCERGGSGAKSLSGLPVTDTSADNTGTPGHFRLYASDGTTCHMQGTVTFTGSGGDMTVDVSGSITAGQQFSVTAFTITEGNA
jgi:hypothetical protein